MAAKFSWLLPHLTGAPATRANNTADASGIPTKYYDAGSGSERAGGSSPRTSAGTSVANLWFASCFAALAARADLVGYMWLTLHSAGLAPDALLDAARGHAPLLTLAYVAISFVGAAYGYYKHCSAIEAWCDAQPAGSEAKWKIQPHATASASSRALSRRLGTFNAGCAAVYGTASTLAALHGGYGIKLYFSIREHGALWYLLSWPLFFCWIELFAWTFHRFFHLKFIYKHFHKLHHRFQPPTAFSAVAFHPVEFACFVFGGQMIFFLLPIHPSVLLVQGFYTAYHLIEDHSGIANTAAWPWQPSTTFHDDHHRYFHCNFGMHVLWWDYLFGTLRHVSRDYDEETFGGSGRRGGGAGGGGGVCAAAKGVASKEVSKVE